MALSDKELNIHIKATDTASPVMQKLQARIQQLKSVAGEDSLLGGIGKLGRGAGALAGVTVLANSIKNAADGVTELRTQWNMGEIDGKQFAAGLARQVPVIGQVTKMFDSLQDAIFGWTADLKAANAETEKLGKKLDMFKGFEAAMSKGRAAFDSIVVRDKEPAILAELRKQIESEAASGNPASAGRIAQLQEQIQRIAAAEQQRITEEMQVANINAASEAAKRQSSEQARSSEEFQRVMKEQAARVQSVFLNELQQAGIDAINSGKIITGEFNIERQRQDTTAPSAAIESRTLSGVGLSGESLIAKQLQETNRRAIEAEKTRRESVALLRSVDAGLKAFLGV